VPLVDDAPQADNGWFDDVPRAGGDPLADDDLGAEVVLLEAILTTAVLFRGAGRELGPDPDHGGGCRPIRMDTGSTLQVNCKCRKQFFQLIVYGFSYVIVAGRGICV
jgi:hypothetical protein